MLIAKIKIFAKYTKNINKIPKILYNEYTERGNLMKKVTRTIIIIIIVAALIFITLVSINNKNNKYLNKITKDIKENYEVKEEITYSNKYGNYYIFTTNKKVIVLNKEYEEILKEDIDILDDNKNNFDLIYKNNKLMYEETILKKEKLTYKYYDATNNELIKETIMEKK